MTWLRLHTDIIEDENAIALSDKQFRLWVYILCYVKEKGGKDDLDSETGRVSMDIPKAARRFRVSPSVLKSTIHLFASEEYNIITIESEEKNSIEFTVKNWQKRQYCGSYRRVKKTLKKRAQSVNGALKLTSPLTHRKNTDNRSNNSNELFCPETSQTEVCQTESPPLLVFPTDGTPGEWYLTADLVRRYEETFQSLDVMYQCRKALLWIEANPSRRKTYRGMQAFLTGWMGRAQNNPREPKREETASESFGMPDREPTADELATAEGLTTLRGLAGAMGITFDDDAD